MREATQIAALCICAVSMAGAFIAIIRYLPRIARAITTWADLPGKVEANTQAIAANTSAVERIETLLTAPYQQSPNSRPRPGRQGRHQ